MRRLFGVFAIVLISTISFAAEPSASNQGYELNPNAETETKAEEQEKVSLSLCGVIDGRTSFYYRAYKIMNYYVVQPDVTLTLKNLPVGPFKVSPYIDFWQNFSEIQGNSGTFRHWTESDINPGFVIAYNRISLDFNYLTNFLPSGINDKIKARGADGQEQELDVTFGYDDTKEDKGNLGPFKYNKGLFVPIALQPHILYVKEFEDRADHDLNSYLEFGFEPEFTRGEKWSFTIPALLGCSLHSYYTDNSGHNDFLGYLQTGTKVKYQLDRHWEAHAGCDYIYAMSSSIPVWNGTGRNISVGFFGFGFEY